MDRKKGYYWVKATPESSWEIAFFKKDLSFDGDWIFGTCFVDEDFFHAIDECRIERGE